MITHPKKFFYTELPKLRHLSIKNAKNVDIIEADKIVAVKFDIDYGLPHLPSLETFCFTSLHIDENEKIIKTISNANRIQIQKLANSSGIYQPCSNLIFLKYINEIELYCGRFQAVSMLNTVRLFVKHSQTVSNFMDIWFGSCVLSSARWSSYIAVTPKMVADLIEELNKKYESWSIVAPIPDVSAAWVAELALKTKKIDDKILFLQVMIHDTINISIEKNSAFNDNIDIVFHS